MDKAETLAPQDAAESPGLELTILMPCLNEAETLGTCVRKAMDYLARSGIPGEVLVADNGSTDGSQAIAESLGARVVAVPERGYGAALIAGIAAARGRFVIMGDSDDSYDFTALDPFVAKLREGYELVMGNRFKGGIKPGAMPPLHRYLGNPVLSTIGRLFFGSPVGDFHCGLRGFDRDAMRRLELRAPGMEFASEMVVKATVQGLRIAEVPTTLSPDGRSRPPHLRSWRDGWRHLRFLLVFCPRWLFLYPGAGLFLAGLIAMALLLPGPVRLGGLTFDVHTLLYASGAMIMGFQAVQFWAFARIYGAQEGVVPEERRLTALLARFGLEPALVVAGLLVVLGLGLGVAAVAIWGAERFGPLPGTGAMRVAIASVTAMVLGLQLAFGAFFVALLGMMRAPRR
ncbi:glycosyltransferase family 2 protein [Roseomonas alkaliterrae]|uniref:Glycosyltransferase involved in cell wall biosynthesis n=1 Tax=Neoroseomonas alkaliterrae TaxID=1452450 RepID=A0A840XMH6_9PROT|nr:glycosyltransferase family 2 protein [Neoroseomonas alkaliterrae]MBB5689795.1 glycosyltransferase involved in cell wall biosynthesis [Neoroseomonas alkaliterrae]MBR0675629.1 glycosyltransferase family 2 protein [Neoroseomonas alkaliterrae]